MISLAYIVSIAQFSATNAKHFRSNCRRIVDHQWRGRDLRDLVQTSRVRLCRKNETWILETGSRESVP